jgi:hypothetical protein
MFSSPAVNSAVNSGRAYKSAQASDRRIDEPIATFAGGNPIGGLFSKIGETVFGVVVEPGEFVYYDTNELVPVETIPTDDVSMEQIQSIIDHLLRKNGPIVKKEDRDAFDAFIAMLIKFMGLYSLDMPPPQECVSIIELCQLICKHKNDIIREGGCHIVKDFGELIKKLEIILYGGIKFGCVWNNFCVNPIGKITIENGEEIIVKKMSGKKSDSPYRGCPCCSWDPYKPVVCGIICTLISDDGILYNFADNECEYIDTGDKLRVYISSAGFLLKIDPSTDRPIWPKARREFWYKDFYGNDDGNIEIRIHNDGQNLIVSFVKVNEDYESDLESFHISKDDPVSLVSVNNIACMYTTQMPPIEYFVDKVFTASSSIEQINKIVDTIERKKIADEEARVRAQEDAAMRAEAAIQLAEANTIALYQNCKSVRPSLFYIEFAKPIPDCIVEFPISKEEKAEFLKKMEYLDVSKYGKGLDSRLLDVKNYLIRTKSKFDNISNLAHIADDINFALLNFEGVKGKAKGKASKAWDEFTNKKYNDKIDEYLREFDVFYQESMVAVKFMENLKAYHRQETFYDYVNLIKDSFNLHYDIIIVAEVLSLNPWRDMPNWRKLDIGIGGLSVAFSEPLRMWAKNTSNDAAIILRIKNVFTKF